MTIEHRVREVVDEYVARVRHDLDAHVEVLTADLVRMAAEQEDQQEQQAAEQQAAQEQAGEVIKAARSVHAETLQRLLGSIRRIDESDGLNGILETLAQAVEAQTSRVAILLVDGYMFRTWGHFGFEDGTAPTELPIGASGTLASAVAVRQTSFVPPVTEDRESPEPAFMRLAEGHTGLVVPLSVGGEVVGVLYADDMTRSVAQEDVPLWIEEVELLARHAAVRLENVTSVRAVEALAAQTDDGL